MSAPSLSRRALVLHSNPETVVPARGSAHEVEHRSCDTLETSADTMKGLIRQQEGSTEIRDSGMPTTILNADEALRRVKLIVPMLQLDVRTAMLAHAAMEASNDIVPKGMEGLHNGFTATFNVVQQALAMKLALDVARVFDLSSTKRRSPETQNQASVLVLAALFKRADVQAALENEAAKNWYPGDEYVGAATSSADVRSVVATIEASHRSVDRAACRQAIYDFLSATACVETAGSIEEGALKRIREFRNHRLAHSLFDKHPDELPQYADLNALLEVAKVAAQHAKFAVEGGNIDFEEHARLDRANAEGYANCLLDGLKRRGKPTGKLSMLTQAD